MIEHNKYDIVALQETKLWTYNNFTIKGFSCVRRDGHYNKTPHGGVALFIHQDSAFYEVQM